MRHRKQTLHRRIALAVSLIGFAALLLVSNAGASLEVVKEITNSSEGIIEGASALAVDDSTGEVYATNTEGRPAGPSVLGFSPQGQFNLKLGDDVVASGPDDSTNHEVMELTVEATGGTFALGFSGNGETEFNTGAVFRGDETVGSTTISNVEFGEHMPAVGEGIYGFPSETTITAVNVSAHQIVVSQPATTNFTQVKFLATNMPYNISAGGLEAELDALPSVGGAGGSVTVTGGPGDASGSHPYVITFGGSLAGDAMGAGSPEPMELDNNTLTGSSSRLKLKIAAYGGGPEICRPTAGDVCKPALPDRWQNNVTGVTELAPWAPQEGHGGFLSPGPIAVDQATGNVYVAAGNNQTSVIQEFTPSGAYVTGFGEKSEGAVSASPGKIHQVGTNSLAVNPVNGDVYLIDAPIGNEGRVMVFKPKTVADKEYEYAGRAHDLFVGADSAYALYGFGVDAQGDVYIGQEADVNEFDAADLGSYEFGDPSVPPTHQFNATKAHLLVEPMTIDPSTGRVLFYSSKGNTFHELNPDLELVAGGEFPAPEGESGAPSAMAFSPGVKWSPSRPAGVLYLGLGGASFGGHFSPRILALAEAETFPPTVGSPSVNSVGATFATVKAQVNPRGFQATYRFLYGDEGPCSSNPCSEVPLGGASAGAANEARSLSIGLSGLEPEATYDWEVVAENTFGKAEVEGPAFTTYPITVPGLPDGRAYELVSPVQKHDGELLPLEPDNGSCSPACEPGLNRGVEPNQAAIDGESVVYEATPFSAGAGSPHENEYLATRTATGWQTTQLTPETPRASGEGFRQFSPDLSHAIFAGRSGLPLASEAVPGDLYLRDSGASSLQPLITAPAPNRGAELTTQLAGTSADYSHVFFAANDSLTAAEEGIPAAPPVTRAEDDLYEWNAGKLRLVDVAPDGTALPDAAFGSGKALTESTESAPNYGNAISADGSRAFWTDKSSGKLYVREDGERTLEVPDSGRCLGSLSRPERVCFLTASTDGSKVLLNDGRIYDVGASEVTEATDLTEAEGLHQGGFEGILATSDDLSSVYFVMGPTAQGSGTLAPGSSTVTDVNATMGSFSIGQTIEGAGIPAGTTITAVGSGTLQLSAAATVSEEKEEVSLIAQHLLSGEEENEYGAKARAGGLNLYAYREGATTFLGTLLPADNKLLGLQGDWTASPVNRLAQLSPDGRWLAFMSTASLTGYPNAGHSEAYLYDTATGRLSCASCNPTGLSPTANSNLPTITTITNHELVQPSTRFLTDSGRLYFDSFESLSPNDVNGGVEDVYEYEPDGVGTCGREAGCVSLISTGHGAYDSGFFSVDESGGNVFFSTRNRLLPADKDELVDLYDAREGGGIAAETETERPECQGEACQHPVEPPIDSTPGSLTYQGPGNEAPESAPGKGCPTGKVRKAGKCVAKHQAKHRKHKRANRNRRTAR
jgi:DNA-binding beta-propeller fold protein YncE